MIQRFEYDEATRLLTDALATDLPVEEELVAWSLLVEVRAKASDEQGAATAARELYTRDPGRRLPSAEAMPPRIREVFVEARERAQSDGPADVELEAAAVDGQTVIRGALGGSGLAVRLRLGIDDGSGMVEHTPRLDARAFEQRGPAASELRYYVIAEAPSGFVVAQAGTWAAPRRLRVDGRELEASDGLDDGDGPSLVPWIVAGAVVVVAAVLLGVLFAAKPWVEQPTLPGEVVIP